jgi:hypothetical protein
MNSLSENMNEFKKQLDKGVIQKAYKGLLEYILDLKTDLKNKYPDYYVSGSIYYGYMDMTYFAIFPESFKQRNLKAAIVFNYDKFRFEIWLAGYNKQVQNKYWNLFKENNWNKYHIISTVKGADSIVEHVLADNPDFSDLDLLTKQIEEGTMSFIKDIEKYLERS